jgi:hypothetical protein
VATLSVQDLKRTGLGPTYGACAGGGDRFAPSKDTFLHVKNASGSPITVTVAATYIPLKDQTESNVSVSVPAGGERMIGPFPYEHFAATDGSGLADITYSGVTSLTIAAVKTNQP